MPLTEIVCPNCLKHVPMDQEQETTFCIYCGKELPQLHKAEANSLPDLHGIEGWNKLFDEGKYSEIMSLAALSMEDAGDENARVYYMLAKLSKLYTDYVEDIYRDDEKKGAFGRLFSSLGGKSSDRPIHESFMKSVVKMMGEFMQVLESVNNMALKQSGAERAIGVMVKIDLTEFTQSVSVAYEMLEKHIVPLIVFLGDTELESFNRVYGQIGKTRYFSREILRTFKKEIKARNIS